MVWVLTCMAHMEIRRQSQCWSSRSFHPLLETGLSSAWTSPCKPVSLAHELPESCVFHLGELEREVCPDFLCPQSPFLMFVSDFFPLAGCHHGR
ncbi:hypothetical protein LEMLEM_LOCUS22069 [Lemmus lemmus]